MFGGFGPRRLAIGGPLLLLDRQPCLPTRIAMKKATLIAVTCALAALAGCNRGNQDQLNATDVEQNLDALSNDAANVASEAQELQNQASNLQNQAEAVDNASGPETAADENIQGM
jgi:hypothetical protein